MTVVASNSSISQEPGTSVKTPTVTNASHGYPIKGFSQDPYPNMFTFFAKINVNIKKFIIYL
jgi:hypothetical protein